MILIERNGRLEYCPLVARSILGIGKTNNMMHVKVLYVPTLSSIMEATIKKIEKRQSLYLASTLNFYFYLGVVPFKIVYRNQTDEYYIYEHKIQKFFCGCCHLGAVLVSGYITANPSLVVSDRNAYLVRVLDFFILIIFSCCGNLNMIFILWRRKNEWLQLVQFTRVKGQRNAKRTSILVSFISLVKISLPNTQFQTNYVYRFMDILLEYTPTSFLLLAQAIIQVSKLIKHPSLNMVSTLSILLLVECAPILQLIL